MTSTQHSITHASERGLLKEGAPQFPGVGGPSLLSEEEVLRKVLTPVVQDNPSLLEDATVSPSLHASGERKYLVPRHRLPNKTGRVWIPAFYSIEGLQAGKFVQCGEGVEFPNQMWTFASYAEIDTGSLEEQWNKIFAVLPEPLWPHYIWFSGNKSLHMLWAHPDLVPAGQNLFRQGLLAQLLGGDKSLGKRNARCRVPGYMGEDREQPVLWAREGAIPSYLFEEALRALATARGDDFSSLEQASPESRVWEGRTFHVPEPGSQMAVFTQDGRKKQPCPDCQKGSSVGFYQTHAYCFRCSRRWSLKVDDPGVLQAEVQSVRGTSLSDEALGLGSLLDEVTRSRNVWQRENALVDGSELSWVMEELSHLEEAESLKGALELPREHLYTGSSRAPFSGNLTEEELEDLLCELDATVEGAALGWCQRGVWAYHTPGGSAVGTATPYSCKGWRCPPCSFRKITAMRLSYLSRMQSRMALFPGEKWGFVWGRNLKGKTLRNLRDKMPILGEDGVPHHIHVKLAAGPSDVFTFHAYIVGEEGWSKRFQTSMVLQGASFSGSFEESSRAFFEVFQEAFNPHSWDSAEYDSLIGLNLRDERDAQVMQGENHFRSSVSRLLDAALGGTRRRQKAKSLLVGVKGGPEEKKIQETDSGETTISKDSPQVLSRRMSRKGRKLDILRTRDKRGRQLFRDKAGSLLAKDVLFIALGGEVPPTIPNDDILCAQLSKCL
jgi:hypothetical protein